MSNFITRLVSALVGVALFLFMVLYSKWSYFLLFGVISSICLYEFLNLDSNFLKKRDKYFGIIIGFLSYSVSFLIVFDILDLEIIYIFPFIMLIFFYSKIFSTNNTGRLESLSMISLGLLYVILPFCLTHSLIIHEGAYNYKNLLFTFFCIWGSDTGGYLVGMTLGKKKILPSISPKKTWEGVIGGIVFSLLAGYLSNCYMNFFENEKIVFFLSLLITVFSILGDFFESFVKRSFGVKDSGNIIPGHGGMLDRFDSFMSAVIVLVLFMKFFVYIQ